MGHTKWDEIVRPAKEDPERWARVLANRDPAMAAHVAEVEAEQLAAEKDANQAG